MFNGYYVSYEKIIFDNKYFLTMINGYNKRKFSFRSYYCQEHKKQVKKLVIKFGGEIYFGGDVKFETKKQANDFINFIFDNFKFTYLRNYNSNLK